MPALDGAAPVVVSQSSDSPQNESTPWLVIYLAIAAITAVCYLASR